MTLRTQGGASFPAKEKEQAEKDRLRAPVSYQELGNYFNVLGRYCQKPVSTNNREVEKITGPFDCFAPVKRRPNRYLNLGRRSLTGYRRSHAGQEPTSRGSPSLHALYEAAYEKRAGFFLGQLHNLSRRRRNCSVAGVKGVVAEHFEPRVLRRRWWFWHGALLHQLFVVLQQANSGNIGLFDVPSECLG